ncbi:hypothetical protein L0F63_006219 [Massospora cicadina]|nr:hypothetical protein L0F63_006219 [Massospora cicadina]
MRRVGLFILLACAVCDIVLHPTKDPKLTFNSFGVFPTNPPVNPNKHDFLAPKINQASCEFEYDSMAEYAGTANGLALIVVPTDACLSYAAPVANLKKVKGKLTHLGYPTLDAIVWVSLPGELQPPGNPNSDIMLPSFPKDANVSYNVIPDAGFTEYLGRHKNPIEGYILERECPWHTLLQSYSVRAVSVTFDIIKALMLGVQVSNSSGYIPFLLLAAGFLQLGGDLIISRYQLFGMGANVFIMTLLIVACLVNSLAILSWYRILRRLDLAPVRVTFLAAVSLESAILLVALVIQLALVILLNHRWKILSGWFTGMLVLTMILITAFPLLIKSWLVTQIMRFSLGAGPMRRLTFTIFFTRIAFMVLMLSSNLQFHQSTTPTRYFAFGTIRDLALLIYNAMSILTVLSIQAIRPPKADDITLIPSSYAYKEHEKRTSLARKGSSSSQTELFNDSTLRHFPNLTTVSSKSNLGQSSSKLPEFKPPFMDDSFYTNYTS